MPARPPYPIIDEVSEHDELTALRDRIRADEVALRREEDSMASSERELERELEAFEQDEERTKQRIEDEWRRERFGREPERPPAWRSDEA